MKRAFLPPLLLLLLTWGCSSDSPITEEALLERYQTSNAERDEIRIRLQSSNLKEVYKGLNQIQKNPQSLNLYRDEVMRLNKTSSDAQTVRITTDILNR